MKYSPDQLNDIASREIINSSLQGQDPYEWIDFVAIPQRPETVGSNLLVASYSDGSAGWEYPYDRRTYSVKACLENGWDLATDTPLDGMEQVPTLQANSLDQLAQLVYEKSRETSSPYIVGVTGSVGKTTTVAFLEHLLETNGIGVTRFYSKRLTPLSVKCHYINRVGENTPVVVMEYSAYHKNHVGDLAGVLPPDIAFMLNIYDTHINPDNPEMFSSKKDILASKLRIRPTNSQAFVNQRILEELGVKTPEGWNTFRPMLPKGISNRNMPPTLRTAELYEVGHKIAQQLNLTEQQLNTAFQTFIPKENRIITFDSGGRTIFFNGETSGGSRLWSWFETPNGEVPWLFVEEVDFADENPEGFKDLTQAVFSSDKTVVLDTPQNRKRLEHVSNVCFCSKLEFGDSFKKAKGYIIYHKAMATRTHNFDPEKWVKANI